jgi:hypothetical protein
MTLLRTHSDHTTSMLTGLLLWLCTLPIVGLLILPWLGTRVAVGVAVSLLIVTVTTCYALCGWRRAGPEGEDRHG